LCSVRFSPDGDWLLTTGGGFRLWSIDTWEEGPSLGGPAAPSAAAFSADGSLLALEDVPGVVRLVKPGTGREVVRLSTLQQTRLFPQGFTPDGTRLVCRGREDEALHIFDLRLIRAGLAELDLDWDAPPYSRARVGGNVPPLAVTFDRGDFDAYQTAKGVADELRGKGDLAGALAVIRKAQAITPDDADLNNYLAWLLAICPDPKLRDARRAVELARKAVDTAQDRWQYLRTLGLAQHFAGDDKAAVQALARSLELRRGGDAFDYFSLAAAHQRLGHKEDARNWYDQGVAWVAANKHPHAAELAVLRADAEALLGIEKQGKPAPDK
jgi:tetratricopeptide (TPR) repeat protein